jgi:hypothetical protein
MGKLKKITLLMDDDEELEFIPIEVAESYLSISRGYRDKIADIPNMFPVKEPNGNEVFVLVSAPKEIKEAVVKAAMEVVDKMINT